MKNKDIKSFESIKHIDEYGNEFLYARELQSVIEHTQWRRFGQTIRKAINAGVKDLSKFHNSGYKCLYNGESADDIAKRKGLRYREDILDNMGSDELIANMNKISQTEQKLIIC